MAEKYREFLNQRLIRQPMGFMDVNTTMKHLALINYAVPKERFERYIPLDRFEIPEFETLRGKVSFFSVVLLMNSSFHFPMFLKWPKISFYQANHRAYVIDKHTGDNVVWFFGTNLGTRFVHASQWLWKMPWNYTKFDTEYRYNKNRQIYEKFCCTFRSKWCDGEVDIEDMGQPVGLLDGFSNVDEFKLILTHPTVGFTRRADKRLVTYHIWHPEMQITSATSRHLYFSFYERQGILSPQEMNNPHSIFLCPKVEFDVHLPPQVVGNI